MPTRVHDSVQLSLRLATLVLLLSVFTLLALG